MDEITDIIWDSFVVEQMDIEIFLWGCIAVACLRKDTDGVFPRN